MNEELLSAKQVAGETGYTRERITQLIRAGTIKATRVGDFAYAITRSEADRFKEHLAYIRRVNNR
jgi:hypothetical protein